MRRQNPLSARALNLISGVELSHWDTERSPLMKSATLQSILYNLEDFRWTDSHH